MQRSLAAAIGVVGALALGGAVLAGTTQYRSEPVGAFELPTATNSTAEGSFKLKLAPDGESARFDLKITEPIENVTQSHLHLGGASDIGGVVVWLYPAAPPAMLIPGTTDGQLASGTITVDNLVGTLAGDWDGFVTALEEGQIYVNVHTSAFPGGEIRDQVHAHPGD
jgi:hypothetical protein